MHSKRVGCTLRDLGTSFEGWDVPYEGRGALFEGRVHPGEG